MTIPVLSAAKHLAERSGWTLTNLELQKILYISHMFYMGRYNGQPLVSGTFEAWDYGPVQPDLYHKAKIFGSDPVKNVFHGVAPPPPNAARAMLDEAYAKLSHALPGRLVAATHRTGGAWHKNYIPGKRHCTIPNADILDEYQRLGGANG